MLLNTGSSQSFLSEELARRMKGNPRYSQRAFARQLGLSPGELSEVLRGKRALSLRSAIRIARALSLSPAEARHLIELSQVEKTRELAQDGLLGMADAEIPAKQLTLDVFHLVSDWYCFAILNLAECEGFRADAAWISTRLGVSRAEARIALERLERVGLIERRGGRLEVAPDFVMSPDGIPSEAIRNAHRQILAKATEALETQSVSERDITGLGIALDPKHLPAIKRDIAEFQNQLVAKYSKGRKSEVYYLETAFFRLTRKTAGVKNEN